MTNYECRILAERLAIKSIKRYEEKFLLEQDLLNGIDRQRVLDEIDKIIEDVRTDKVGGLKRENRNLQMRLEHLASLEDCDEEFEM